MRRLAIGIALLLAACGNVHRHLPDGASCASVDRNDRVHTCVVPGVASYTCVRVDTMPDVYECAPATGAPAERP